MLLMMDVGVSPIQLVSLQNQIVSEMVLCSAD